MDQIIGAIQCPKGSKKIKDCQYKVNIEINNKPCYGRAINGEEKMKEQSHVLALVCSPRPGKILKVV